MARVELTHDAWLICRDVLLGGDPDGCSMRYAAGKAGVPLRYLKTAERLGRSASDAELGDAAVWIRDVPAVIDEAEEQQGQVLADELWRRALNGSTENSVVNDGETTVTTVKVKFDNNLALRLLEKRDPSYRRSQVIENQQSLPEGLRPLYEAMMRFAKLRDLRGDAIEIEAPPERIAPPAPRQPPKDMPIDL